MDYYEKYLKQIKNVGYPQFDRYLQLYYSKDDDYTRTVLDDSSLQLKSKDGKSTIKLVFGKSINLHKEKDDILKEKKLLIFELNNLLLYSDISLSNKDVKLFEEIKEKLIINNKSFENLEKVFNDFDKLKKNLSEQLNNLKHELYLLFNKRKTYYNYINELDSELFNKFKDIFLNEKNIDTTRVKSLSKKFNLEEKKIKCLFNWFLVSKKYIKLQNIIDEENINYKNRIESITNVFYNFYIEDPLVTISGDKIIKVRKPTSKDINSIQDKEDEKDELLEPTELSEEDKLLEKKEDEDEEDSEEEIEEGEETDTDDEEDEDVEEGEEAGEDLEESEGEDIIEPGDKTEVKIQEKEDGSEDESEEEENEAEAENKKGGEIKHINISQESIKDISTDNLNLIM